MGNAEPAIRSVGQAAGERSAMHDRHRVVSIGIVAFVVAVSMLGWSPTPGVALGLAVAAAAIGLPHGALDVAIGPALAARQVYFALYGALAALIVAAWIVAPAVSLAVFFAMSWFHFGSGDASGDVQRNALGDGPETLTKRLHGVATGGLVVGLPLAAHADITSQVLDPLLLGRGEFTPSMAVAWGGVILAVAIPAAIVATVDHVRHRAWSLAGELVALALLGLVVHPLVAFAVYFVVVHSPRHLIEMAPSRSAIAPTALASVATIGGAAAFWFVLEPSAATSIRIVFIGLAALTAPHLVTTFALSRGLRPTATRPREMLPARSGRAMLPTR